MDALVPARPGAEYPSRPRPSTHGSRKFERTLLDALPGIGEPRDVREVASRFPWRWPS
jgi:hypothetical protein